MRLFNHLASWRMGMQTALLLMVLLGLTGMGLTLVGCGASTSYLNDEEISGPYRDAGDITGKGDAGGGGSESTTQYNDSGPGENSSNQADAPPTLAPEGRVCPDKLGPGTGTSFTGQACDGENSSSCKAGCMPANLPALQTETSSFFADCSKPEVLCVGAGQEVASLSEAANKAQSDSSITHIKIASGRYVESVTFQNIQQDLTVEGQSNDPSNGAVLVAPLPPRPVEDYATLSFRKVGKLTISRLVVSGYGHGLFVNDFVSVNINNSHHTTNLLTGAMIKGNGNVFITDSRFVYNGGVLQFLPKGTISVNINNSHRVTGQGTISVNINNSHRVTGNDTVAVNINNSHRIPGLVIHKETQGALQKGSAVVGQWRTQVEALQFGLVVEGANEVTLQNNRVTGNGVGGLRISPGGDEIAVNINNSHRIVNNDHVSVNINNSHRVVSNDTVSVNINNSHRVVMEGNRIADNGPRGWFAASQAAAPGCDGGCSGSHFCEGSVCLPKMGATINGGKRNGQTVVAGVGALVAGAGELTAKGNSFFRNDSSGIFARSINIFESEANALELNGQRSPQLLPSQFLFPAIQVAGVTQRITFKANLLTDSPGHGLLVTKSQPPKGQAVDVVVANNYVAGIGRTLPEGSNASDGIRLDHRGFAQPLQLSMTANSFRNNRRSGLSLLGYITGSISKNKWVFHPFRAIAIHDTFDEQLPTNTLTLEDNTVSGASGYGIQLYGGGAQITLRRNYVENVRGVGGSQEENVEGDAINLVALKATTELLENTVTNNHRAGIFMHNIKVKMENNKISNCRYGAMMQSGAEYTGDNEMKGNQQDSRKIAPSNGDLPNRKDF
ncbi:MAG: right-handed parallel beta-helix repeat-containing protein [Deltaproteobacteria bacterium]|nr:MAG: right-handed parallel beta-helix repeat-containing protein [Deltaproteobacteria bacterium]